MELFTDILTPVAKTSPVIAVLIVWLYLTLKKLTKKEEEIESLSKELRQSEKDNVALLSKVNDSLTDIVEDNKEATKEIVTEIKEVRELIHQKLTKS